MKFELIRTNTTKGTRFYAVFAWGLYFAILLVIATWVRDIPNQPDPYTVTIDQLPAIKKLGDPGFFAIAAQDVAENGWVSPQNAFVFNLWPPGFVLLEAAIIKVLGSDAPVILVLQVLAAGLFAWLLTLLSLVLRSWIRTEAALLAPLLIFLFPVARVFLLQPTGVTLGETFGIGFFLIGLIFALSAIEKHSVRYAVYSGACLALAAYFRSQFELFVLALTGWGALYLLWMAIRGVRKGWDEARLLEVRHMVRTILLVVVVAHALMMPWRLYHAKHHHTFQWVQTSSLVFANSVKSSEDLTRAGAGFVVAGGGNLPCRIDPETCGHTEDARKLFIRTFLAHPVEWYSLKFEVIGHYWFAPVENWGVVTKPPTPVNILVNGTLLLSLAGVIALLFMPAVRRHRLWPVLLWFNVAVFSAHALIFSLAHFEVRYFYFLKIYGFFMLITETALLARFYGQSDERKTV